MDKVFAVTNINRLCIREVVERLISDTVSLGSSVIDSRGMSGWVVVMCWLSVSSSFSIHTAVSTHLPRIW